MPPHAAPRLRRTQVAPTFPSRDPTDRRLRKADRLRAGETLVRALWRHLAANARLVVLEITSAPLRLYDWQHLGSALRNNGCPLRRLSLAGSRLGDAGLAVFGPALLAHPTLVALSLDGCGLTEHATAWLLRLLRTSNLRLKEARARSDVAAWARGLKDGAAGWPCGLGRREQAWAAAEEEEAEEALRPAALEVLTLAGNSLGALGGRALAAYLARDLERDLDRDHWLVELDLRFNGIDAAGVAQLRQVAADREAAEEKREDPLPPLRIALEGNAREADAPRRASLRCSASREEARRRGASGSPARWRLVQPRPWDVESRRMEAGFGGALGGATEPAEPIDWRTYPSATERGDRLHRAARRIEEVRMRSNAARVRAKASKATTILHGALASSVPDAAPLSSDDWAGLVEASGGAGHLLDAMDGLIAAALRKVVPSE